MAKITFSNGEMVEWNNGNLPDKLTIYFKSPESPPVPDHISADHIEGLCNLLTATLQYAIEHDPSPLSVSKYQRYWSAIGHARDRAEALRKGQI